MIASPSPLASAGSSSLQGSAWIWHLSAIASSAQIARARSTWKPDSDLYDHIPADVYFISEEFARANGFVMAD